MSIVSVGIEFFKYDVNLEMYQELIDLGVEFEHFEIDLPNNQIFHFERTILGSNEKKIIRDKEVHMVDVA